MKIHQQEMTVVVLRQNVLMGGDHYACMDPPLELCPRCMPHVHNAPPQALSSTSSVNELIGTSFNRYPMVVGVGKQNL